MAGGQSEIPEDIQISLDHGSDVPLYRQIVDRLWLDVINGSLEPGARLPTVRQLAIDLGVHPDTVERAYTELELLGVVFNKRGEGTFVGLKPPNTPELERREQLERLCREMVARGRSLGFEVADIIEMLKELRAADNYDKR